MSAIFPPYHIRGEVRPRFGIIKQTEGEFWDWKYARVQDAKDNRRELAKIWVGMTWWKNTFGDPQNLDYPDFSIVRTRKGGGGPTGTDPRPFINIHIFDYPD